jgi:hypothetical protein
MNATPSSFLRSAIVLAALLLFPAAANAAPEKSYAGVWDSSFGHLTFKVKAGKVTGHYSWEGQTGHITGVVKGKLLKFTYQDDAGKGEGHFRLAEDGQSFQGQWREIGDVNWSAWSAVRIKASTKTLNFSGLWKSSFGRMRLVQSGKKVHGIYGYSAHSSLRGEVKDGVFQFQYSEAKGQDTGKGEFRLSSDGQELKGRWRVTGEAPWKDWTASRIYPKSGRKWLIVLEARWEESLEEQEYSFGRMLKSFFARTPAIGVRQRTFSNTKALQSWCREIAFIAEPAVVLIATHGSPKGLQVGDQTIGAKDMATSLRYATNIKLLHFSSCLIMKDRVSTELLRELGADNSFPISGYTRAVDWAASAVIEFMYYDLILSRNLAPKIAAAKLLKLLPFAGASPIPGAPFESAGFKFIDPRDFRQMKDRKPRKAPKSQ